MRPDPDIKLHVIVSVICSVYVLQDVKTFQQLVTC